VAFPISLYKASPDAQILRHTKLYQVQNTNNLCPLPYLTSVATPSFYTPPS